MSKGFAPTSREDLDRDLIFCCSEIFGDLVRGAVENLWKIAKYLVIMTCAWERGEAFGNYMECGKLKIVAQMLLPYRFIEIGSIASATLGDFLSAPFVNFFFKPIALL